MTFAGALMPISRQSQHKTSYYVCDNLPSYILWQDATTAIRPIEQAAPHVVCVHSHTLKSFLQFICLGSFPEHDSNTACINTIPLLLLVLIILGLFWLHLQIF